MAELLIELLSEEIPARMQQAAASRLRAMLETALKPLNGAMSSPFYTARRLAVWGAIDLVGLTAGKIERGPRVTAPPAALDGFLRKFGAMRDGLEQAEGFWILRFGDATQTADVLIASVLPTIIRSFPWPKSMRWGGASQLSWIRPLKRILCLLDGSVVPFDLEDGSDDGHGLNSGDQTEGHRFMAPGAFSVTSAAQWRDELARRKVIANPEQRRMNIEDGLAGEAAKRGLHVIEDKALLDEVCGLVEWPVPLLGRIDAAFMDLPPEVMQVSMRVNQRYFATRDNRGNPAPYFAFVANIEAPDSGAAIIAGNERVLRARFADARHFWDLDRAVTLHSRVVALGAITFHAKLGTQADRVRRIVRLAGHIAPLIGADREQAIRAAELCKADLTTGMVGEFPELQGVMGSYYAAHDNEPPAVAAAIREHYFPRGPTDPVPAAPVAIAVAIADKLDTLVGFFGIGEAPTGSGDPYALRRAGLGVIRILREHDLRFDLRPLLIFAGGAHAAHPDPDALLAFLIDRLRTQLRAAGAHHDVVNAVFAAGSGSDIVRLLTRADAVSSFLATDAGANLLAAYRRAANILRIEDRKDGPFTGAAQPALFTEPAEHGLLHALHAARPDRALAAEDDAAAMAALATLRPAVDAFFETVKVNDNDPARRANRLRLLGGLRDTMNQAADFSAIEG